MKKYMFIALVSLFANALEYNFQFDDNTDGASKDRLERLAIKINEIIQTQEFYQKATEYQKYSCLSSDNFPSTSIKNAANSIEYLKTAVININIKFFSDNSSVVASTSSDSISFNRNFFDYQKDASLANTLLHEGMHTLGFRHCGKNNIKLFPKIKRSIPYKFGNFVEELF